MSFFKGGRGSKTVTLVDSEEDDIPLRTARASASVKVTMFHLGHNVRYLLPSLSLPPSLTFLIPLILSPEPSRFPSLGFLTSEAKRGGELFVKVFHIEKVGKEMELKKERMKFPMSIEVPNSNLPGIFTTNRGKMSGSKP